MLRISEEDKAAIVEAAGKVAKSATRFVVDATLKEARAVARRPQPGRGVHGGVPTFFRALCFEASHGGASGYEGAARALAGAIAGSQAPYDVEDDEWEQEIAVLKGLLKNDDEVGVWIWFRRHYPACIKLVPVRRREQFVAGVRRAYEKDRIEA